jgi:uncharacterized membrane protein
VSVDGRGAGTRRAAVLGTVTGARTFLAPAALALRGRLGDGRAGKVAKLALPALAAGELVADKLPMAPPRVEGPGLVGRVLSGAFSGRVSAGPRGARVGAVFALAATYPSQVLRAQIVTRTPLPDIACAVPDDLLGIALAAASSPEPRLDVDGPKTQDSLEFSARQHERSRGIVVAAGVGLAAALVGTAAMASAREWVDGFTGTEERRPGLGAAMRVLHGTGWGLPFGVVWGRGRPPGPAKGVTFGLSVWLASLVELPALGVAPPPWEQSPATLAQDLAFHLVYGTATAAAYAAFTA